MELIKRAWRGEEKLWKVFWLLGVLGYVATNLLYELLRVLGDVYISFVGDVIVIIVVQLIFLAFVAIVCWRCAFNVRKKFWGYFARVVSVLSIIYVILTVAMAGVAYLIADQLPPEAKDLYGTVSDAFIVSKCAEEQAHEAMTANLSYEEYQKLHPDQLAECYKRNTGKDFQVESGSASASSNFSSYSLENCETRMIAHARKYKIDPAIYISQTEDVHGGCDPELVRAIKAKYPPPKMDVPLSDVPPSASAEPSKELMNTPSQIEKP